MRTASILHLDLDAFYVGVEQREQPRLMGKPVVVGGGVVLAASYEARRYGIHSGMPTASARRRCPALVVVDRRLGDYSEAGRQVFAVCRRYTPAIEQVSIDEAFMEVSGSVRLFGSPTRIAERMREAVFTETGLVSTVGVATTKFLAKVASRYAKPDGLLLVDPDRELEFLHGLDIDFMWGVGRVLQRRLRRYGIHTIAELAAAPEQSLMAAVGHATGRHLHALAWNRDPRGVISSGRARSVGAQSTFGRDVRSPQIHRSVLRGLADRVARRLRAKDRAGRRITIHVRFADFQTITRSMTLAEPTDTTATIYRAAAQQTVRALTEAKRDLGLRLLGISVSQLATVHSVQPELPLEWATDIDPLLRAGTNQVRAAASVDTAVDAVRARYGTAAVDPASALLRRRRRLG